MWQFIIWLHRDHMLAAISVKRSIIVTISYPLQLRLVDIMLNKKDQSSRHMHVRLMAIKHSLFNSEQKMLMLAAFETETYRDS